MKCETVIISVAAVIFIACLFIPIVFLQGPILGKKAMSPCAIVRDCLPGDAKKDENFISKSINNQIQKELSGIKIPLFGPILIGISVLCLAIAYVAMIAVLAVLCVRRSFRRGIIVWFGSGIAFAILFLIGCPITQSALNGVDGERISHKILGVLSSAVAKVYAVKPGIGAFIIGVTSLIAVLLWFATRKSSHQVSAAQPS